MNSADFPNRLIVGLENYFRFFDQYSERLRNPPHLSFVDIVKAYFTPKKWEY
jgi:hypothetical protein